MLGAASALALEATAVVAIIETSAMILAALPVIATLHATTVARVTPIGIVVVALASRVAFVGAITIALVVVILPAPVFIGAAALTALVIRESTVLIARLIEAAPRAAAFEV